MKLRKPIANLLVFLSTSLSSVWLFQQTRELRDTEILPVKFEQQTQPQPSSRFQRIGPLPTEHSWTELQFLNQNEGWCADRDNLWHTDDGGNTWRDDDYRFKRGCQNYYELEDTHPTGISFSDHKNGLLLFGSGLVAKSTDGGHSWCGIADLPISALPEECHTELPGKFRDIAFKDAKYGIALDCLGVMFESNDGGVTWQKLEEGVLFNSIVFHDNTNAWAVTFNAELIRMRL